MLCNRPPHKITINNATATLPNDFTRPSIHILVEDGVAKVYFDDYPIPLSFQIVEKLTSETLSKFVDDFVTWKKQVEKMQPGLSDPQSGSSAHMLQTLNNEKKEHKHHKHHKHKHHKHHEKHEKSNKDIPKPSAPITIKTSIGKDVTITSTITGSGISTVGEGKEGCSSLPCIKNTVKYNSDGTISLNTGLFTYDFNKSEEMEHFKEEQQLLGRRKPR